MRWAPSALQWYSNVAATTASGTPGSDTRMAWRSALAATCALSLQSGRRKWASHA